MTKQTVEYWTGIVRGAVICTPEQAASIGKLCFDAAANGENCSAWHQSAVYFGHKCNCAKCHPVKGAFKYHHVA